MQIQSMSDSDEKFDDWEESKYTICPKCGSNVKFRTWDSSDGAYTDYNYKCIKCNYNWWVDGPDY